MSTPAKPVLSVPSCNFSRPSCSSWSMYGGMDVDRASCVCLMVAILYLVLDALMWPASVESSDLSTAACRLQTCHDRVLRSVPAASRIYDRPTLLLLLLQLVTMTMMTSLMMQFTTATTADCGRCGTLAHSYYLPSRETRL